MAKIIPSLIKLKGTIYDVTIVDSKKYGRHARAKRGSITPVSINDELEKSKDRLLDSNKAAKLIFDAVRNEHKDGDLWTDLLSIFRKQLKEDGAFSLKDLNKLECSKEFSLNRILHGNFIVEVKARRQKLEITVNLKQYPDWEKRKYLDGYQMTVIAVFPDFEGNGFIKELAHTPILSGKQPLQPFRCKLPMPSIDAAWVLFLRISASSKGQVRGIPTEKGMAVVAVSE